MAGPQGAAQQGKLLMTAEAQTRRQPRWHGSWLHRPTFELLRGQVPQGRVQTDSVVDLLNELRHVLLQFFHRVIGPCVDFLLFQRFEKTLALPVLPRPPGPTHAQDSPDALQPLHIIVAGIL